MCPFGLKPENGVVRLNRGVQVIYAHDHMVNPFETHLEFSETEEMASPA